MQVYSYLCVGFTNYSHLLSFTPSPSQSDALQVFVVTASGHFTSHDLEFRNGKASGCGGAVWVSEGGKAGFFMSKFINNTAQVGYELP